MRPRPEAARLHRMACGVAPLMGVRRGGELQVAPCRASIWAGALFRRDTSIWGLEPVPLSSAKMTL